MAGFVLVPPIRYEESPIPARVYCGRQLFARRAARPFETLRHPEWQRRAGFGSSFIAKRSLAIFGDLQSFDFERSLDAAHDLLRGDNGESGTH